MKIIDIKTKVTELLNSITIDEFYQDSNLDLIKKKVFSYTNSENQQEFEDFLLNQIPELSKSSINKSIQELTNQISLIKKEVQPLLDEVDKTSDEITSLKSKEKTEQKKTPKKKERLKLEISNIQKEINQIRPLASKSPYKNQILKLQTEKDKKDKELEEITMTTSKLKSEIKSLQKSLKAKKEQIKNKEDEVESAKRMIDENKNKIKHFSSLEKTFFQDEFPNIQFVFETLLSKQLDFDAFKREEDSSNVNRPRRRKDVWNASIEKQKVHKISRSNHIELVKPFLTKENIIPKNWRDILFEVFSNQVKGLDGVFYLFEKEIKRESQELSDADISAILATKVASKSNHSLAIGDNKIALALSGGIMALFSFRKKGGNIKLNNNSSEIYAYTKMNGVDRMVKQTLYHQSGYADSIIQIELPLGYYILTDKFVIEVSFKPAPILFENNNLFSGIPNISSIALLEDEQKKKEEEEEEEERRRRDEWDED